MSRPISLFFISYHILNAKIVVATSKYTGVARMSIGNGTRIFFLNRVRN